MSKETYELLAREIYESCLTDKWGATEASGLDLDTDKFFGALAAAIQKAVEADRATRMPSDDDLENEAAYFHLDHPKMSASQMFFEGARWLRSRIEGGGE